MSAERGKHRRRHRISVLGLIIGLVLMAVATAGAMLSPVLTDNRTSTIPFGDSTVDGGSTTEATSEGTPTNTPPVTVTVQPTKPVTPTPVRTTTKPPPVSGIAALEAEVLRLTNVERGKANCAALHLDTRLRTAARNHSADMARNDYFSHTSQNGTTFDKRIIRAGYFDNTAMAENIAYGYPTPAAVMNGWMNSKGHRDNILNCGLKALGVGAVKDPDGRIYWTQDFGGR